MSRLCPRIRYHKNGTASLHGIPARDLKSILTAASLHYYDEDKKMEAAGKTLDMDSAVWYRRQRIILDLTDKLDDAPRLEKYNYTMRPLHTLALWQIRDRQERVKLNAAFRKKLDAMFAKIWAKRVDKAEAIG